MKAENRSWLPLLVGVTGHRDIPEDAESIARLESAVDRIFGDLSRAHPHATVVVVTALADGADQLVARVARRRDLGLLVPLPMPLDVYETTIADRAELQRLLGEDADVFELPLAEGVTRERLLADESARRRQYGVLAAFLARHCHGLIALWDGEGTESPLEGGTAQVITFHRSGVPVPLMPASYPPDPVDRGPTWQVVTPRAGRPAPEGAFEIRQVLPDGYESDDAAREAMRGIRERIDAFNGDLGRDPTHRWSPSSGHELPLGEVLPADVAEALPSHVRRTLSWHVLADAMALTWQRRTHAVLATLPWAAALAIACLQLYADWVASRWLLTAYVIALGIAWAYFWWVMARPRAQDRFQDYRALAEGLRVEVFWQLIGAPGSAADHYLDRQRSELAWMRQAMRTWSLTSRGSREALLAGGRAPDRASLETARTSWIAAQADWYARAARREHARQRRWERARTVGLAGSVAVAIVASLAIQAAPAASWLRAAFDPQGTGAGLEVSELWHSALVTLIAAPAIAAGLVEYWLARRAFAEHARQYARMSADFALVRDRVDALLAEDRLEEAREHLVAAARLALAEHGDWLVLHRERPVDVPQGG